MDYNLIETEVILKPFLGCIFSRIAGETSMFGAWNKTKKSVRSLFKITGRKEELSAFIFTNRCNFSQG
jgi:hypothetical protein